MQYANKYRFFASSPAASPEKPTTKAIVLDCEMAEVKGLSSEVVQVCAVDYLTGTVLLNKLVDPGEKVYDWRPEIHGITHATMQEAVSQGLALAGWTEARVELWKLLDEDTILVGQALQHDLKALRMVHPRVVDSAILAKTHSARRGTGTNSACKKFAMNCLTWRSEIMKEGYMTALKTFLPQEKSFCGACRTKTS